MGTVVTNSVFHLPPIRKNVRTAIVSYLESWIDPSLKPQNQAIPYLASVFGFPEKVTNQDELDLDPGVAYGAGIWLYFPSDTDKPFELGANYLTTGHTGSAVELKLRLICLLRAQVETASDAGEQGEAFLDGLKNVIRYDRNAGDASVIFSWGLGPFPSRSTDISAEQYLPRPRHGGLVDIQSLVEVNIVSLIDPQITT